MMEALVEVGGFEAMPVEVGKSPGPIGLAGVQSACPAWHFGSAWDRAFLAIPQIVVPLMSAKPEHCPELTMRWQLPVPSWMQEAIRLASTFWPSKVDMEASCLTAEEL